MRIAMLLLVLTACGAPPHPARPRLGSIAGLTRDHDSGAVVAKALIQVRGPRQVRPFSTVSNDRGEYDVHQLRPGRYTLTAIFAGQPVSITNIEVRAGEVAIVDVVFTLGQPDPVSFDFNATDDRIQRYEPPNLVRTVSIIEGTISDTSTRERVPGAVVTAATGERSEQTVTDDQGRYRFSLVPGTYSVSAYYSISGRGQIEVRRSDITVGGAEAVVVPLSIETVR